MPRTRAVAFVLLIGSTVLAAQQSPAQGRGQRAPADPRNAGDC
jgi:hypothetical protein